MCIYVYICNIKILQGVFLCYFYVFMLFCVQVGDNQEPHIAAADIFIFEFYLVIFTAYMYYSVIICSLCLLLNFVLTLIFNNPYIVLSTMCLPSLIVNYPNSLNPPTQLVQYITTNKTPKQEEGPTQPRAKISQQHQTIYRQNPQTKTHTIQGLCHDKDAKNQPKANRIKA